MRDSSTSGVKTHPARNCDALKAVIGFWNIRHAGFVKSRKRNVSTARSGCRFLDGARAQHGSLQIDDGRYVLTADRNSSASLPWPNFGATPWIRRIAICFCFFLLAQPAAAASGAVEVQAGVQAFYAGSDTSAWSHFSRAAKEGNSEAFYWLGYMTELGLDTKQDLGKAAQLYERAAVAGWSMAKAKLGHLYLKGEGVTQDFAAARTLLEQAAHDNIADAQFDLGRIYEKGLGTAKDPIYAYVWYNFAARDGIPLYREARDRVLKSMRSDQVTEAQKIVQTMRGSIFGLTAAADDKNVQ